MRRDPIRNLDLLRAVAVLLVVGAHLLGLGPDTEAKGNYRLYGMGPLGVLMFFVHTSLVLMMSLERLGKESTEHRTITWAFYVRRFFRIYPLSILIVLVAVAFNIPSDPFFPLRKLSAVQVAANLLLMQNIARAPSAIGPLWSLPWEVQMYVLLPFLFFAIAKAGRMAAWTALWLVTMAVDALGIGAGIRAVRILDYAPCFLCGVLAFMLIRRSVPGAPSWAWPVTLSVLVPVLVLSPFDWSDDHGAYWAYWIICLVLGLLIPVFADLGANALTRTAHWIAKYSYGIYLFHVPAIWLAFDKLRWMNRWESSAIFLAVTIASSMLAYRYIEHPLIERGRALSTPRPVLAGAGAALFKTEMP